MTAQALARQELFFQNLNIVLEAHLDDPDLDVKRLIRIVGMSRTDLHRKIISKTGMSTMEYVRNMRLKKAAYLLTVHPEWCVSHVAFEVGFCNLSYFTKRFKELFGVCPLQYKGNC